jgi:ribosomal-protein-alanine acetyltransferase
MMTGWRGRRTPAKQGNPAPSADRDGAVSQGDRTGARLRRMVPADLADVMALEHELFPDDPWTDEMFAEEVAQPLRSRLYLIAEAGAARAGEPAMAGYAGMMFVPGGVQADVLTIAVAPRFWDRGIGSALLSALIQAARDRGCTEVFLEVREDNPRARGLYLRRGFEEIGVRRGYYQPSGVDAIVMWKDLRR